MYAHITVKSKSKRYIHTITYMYMYTSENCKMRLPVKVTETKGSERGSLDVVSLSRNEEGERESNSSRVGEFKR